VLCGKGSGVKRIKHRREVDLLHEDCADRYLAAIADPVTPVTSVTSFREEERGISEEPEESATQSDTVTPWWTDAAAQPARPAASRAARKQSSKNIQDADPQWPGPAPRAVEQLAREVVKLSISGAAQLEDAIRTRLANCGVPAEALDVEVEKVVRCIEGSEP
jgi:hypothetical protein